MSPAADPPPDAPLVVDAITEGDGGQLVRLVYFVIRGEENDVPWTLHMQGRSAPFHMLNLAGVICSPVDGGEFGRSDQIDALFDMIEGVDESGLVIETESILLPMAVFPRNAPRPSRGDVWRIGLKALDLVSARVRSAYEMEPSTLLELANQLRHSKEETIAFGEWSKRILTLDHDPKDPQMKLTQKRWGEDGRDVGFAT